MSDLHLTSKGEFGKLYDVTPQSAGWSYVGFGLYRLKPGDEVTEHTAETEVILGSGGRQGRDYRRRSEPWRNGRAPVGV